MNRHIIHLSKSLATSKRGAKYLLQMAFKRQKWRLNNEPEIGRADRCYLSRPNQRRQGTEGQ